MNHHSTPAGQVLDGLNVTKEGLSRQEAESRLARDGKNLLKAGKKKSLLTRIWEQIGDPMILVLIGAAIVCGVFKEYADMVIIFIVITVNATLGILQESKAEKAIEALQKMSAPHTRVRRDGTVMNVESCDLVCGDIVLLEAGDSVPADMRLIQSASLKIEEAALTGESVPSEKSADATAEGEDVPLGDRHSMAYMGTSVTYGRGEGVITGTGMNTEMGKIANILSGTTEEKTPLQQKLAGLSKVLSVAVLGICAFIFVFSLIRGGSFATEDIFGYLLTAVSLAVAAIPEGLVVVVTVVLSIGVTKMSGRNAIIRRLTAVETLGSTQVICSDKTGTLTQNKMTVIKHYGDTQRLATAMYLCSDVQQGEGGALIGDPTEVALVEFAIKSGFAPKIPRINEAPFDSVRKMMSTLHADGEGKGIIQFTKGAPDEVLARCTSIWQNGAVVPLTDALRKKVLADNKSMADDALRVLGAAFRNYDTAPKNVEPEAIETDLTFIGLAGMIDPVRPEVTKAIEECRSAGIRPIMITGDHKDTAVAIGKSLGMISNESEAITGAELSRMSDKEFETRAPGISVYARVQPEHKVRIVKMWKKLGKITAMTGDGVNDAPALKSADIGVGMGITGTDVTKNVADMVLADDNFATIVYAVEEGRRIYENIRKSIQFLLASNLSEVVSIFIATLAGLKLFAPIHILWINLVTDTFPAIALGMETTESDSMQKPPRDAKETIFSDGLGVDVIWQGVVIGILTLLSFFIGYRHSHEEAMTMAFLTLSLCEIFHSFNMRSRHKSIFSLKGHNYFLHGGMVLSFILTMGVMYTPWINDIFQLVPLTLPLFAEALGFALLIIPIVEIVKLVMRKVHKS